jgi:putative transposase
LRKKRHKHITRLEKVYIHDPVYFITTSTLHRRQILANDLAHEIGVEVWRNSERLYDWRIGQYIVMPDHVHFFCRPGPDAKPLKFFVGKWKEWTSKNLNRRANIFPPIWDEEFFDHLLRSSESFSEKWNYVVSNAINAGFVQRIQDWPYQGYISQIRNDEVTTL